MGLYEILTAKYRGIAAIGVDKLGSILRYTLQRDRLDRRYWQKNKIVFQRTPGNYIGCDLVPGGAHIYFQTMELEVNFMAPDLVRVAWAPDQPDLPYLPGKDIQDREPVGLEIRDQYCLLKSSRLQVEIGWQGQITFRGSGGSILRMEEPPVQRLGGASTDRGWETFARLQPDEHIFGLGERASKLNHRFGTFMMWNLEESGHYSPGRDPLYLGIPMYLSLRPGGGYLIFYANSAKARFTFDPEARPTVAEAIFEEGLLHYYFMTGTTDRLINGYAQISGKPALPPRWALGYHQSRWGYQSEADVRQVAQGFADHDLPLSAIHLDIDYMDGYRLFTVDRQRFPDLKKFTDELHEKDIKLVTILDAGLKVDPHYDLYQEAAQKNYFCELPDGQVSKGMVWPGLSAFPDFTAPEVRNWWGKQYQSLIEQGVDGFWHDMNEPSVFTAWGDPTLPMATCFQLEGRRGDYLLAHNLYGLLMDQAGSEGLHRLLPDRRPWILSRSGWAGLQRFAWNWTGDIETSWAGLRQTIATILGLGLSGIPYSGSDIGGFGGDPDAELYLRWFQAAAFMPFFRTHSAYGTERREPWVFGEEITGILRKYLKLRYRLMPYLYTLAWQAAQTGWPLMRPLFWLDENDPGLLENEDSFLIGNDLLVAPVLEEGARSRTVRLPAGEWYDFWEETQESWNGPAGIEVPISLERIPVLARGGSLIPMEVEHHLQLHLYPKQSGESLSQLYSDAGDGYDSSRLDRFEMKWSPDHVTVDWQSDGDYLFPYEDVSVIVHGGKIEHAMVDGEIRTISENQFETGQFRILEVTLQRI